MTISFQGDQYFHPIYGWIDKYRPDMERQNAPNALPAGRQQPQMTHGIASWLKMHCIIISTN